MKDDACTAPPRKLLSPPELETVRRKFTPLLRRGQVFELASMLGYGRRPIEKLIREGALPQADIKQLLGTLRRYGYWHRDSVLETLNVNL